jgi:hypothetical protein
LGKLQIVVISPRCFRPCRTHPSMNISDDWYRVLGDWKKRISAYQTSQYEKAVALERRHYALGVPATIFAAIAGTTVFANLNKDFSNEARITVAVFSVLTAALTATQTFMNCAKRAETYRSVASQLGNIRREIDILETQVPPSREGLTAALRQLNTLIAKVSDDAPLIEAPEGEGGIRVCLDAEW